MAEKALDRMNVPAVFYTPKTTNNSHTNVYGNVFAESDDHFLADWITVGYVSKQTPFGQGTGLGFPKSELREATKNEVLVALTTNHPFGRKYRPNCKTAMDAGFHLIMSDAFRNWTNDDPDGTQPIHNISRNQIREARKTAWKKYNRMMIFWRFICRKQARLIRKAMAIA
jgi:hypothetical protein